MRLACALCGTGFSLSFGWPSCDERRWPRQDVVVGIDDIVIRLDDLNGVAARVPTGTEVLVERRKTFYGSTEMILRDAAGNVVILAEMEK